MQLVRELTRDKNSLDLIFIFKDDIDEDVNVSEEIGDTNHNIICLIFKVSDIATGNCCIQISEFRSSEPAHCSWVVRETGW